MNLRFSVATLLLVIALIACLVSHAFVSQELATTKRSLTALRNDTLMLDADDDSSIYALALPTYGDLQWRWKIQLPDDGEYRIRYAFDQISETGLPASSSKMDAAFLGSDGTPLSGGAPFVLEVSIFESGNKWQLAANNGDRGTGHFLKNASSWIESYTAVMWTSSISGTGKTDSCDSETPLQLIKMRKAKSVPGGSTVDPEPTQGVAIWIERIK